MMEGPRLAVSQSLSQVALTLPMLLYDICDVLIKHRLQRRLVYAAPMGIDEVSISDVALLIPSTFTNNHKVKCEYVNSLLLTYGSHQAI